MNEIPKRDITDIVRVMDTEWARKHNLAGQTGMVSIREEGNSFLGALCTIKTSKGKYIKVHECSLTGA